MSKMKWTSDQEKIIKMRGCNILVSAAAGSGKTAVLIERIFQRIIDSEHPVDVDQFVVVTFTKAAAAQMKDRLRERIETALQEEPDNEHLQKQISLMSAAHISTVHSFCGYVIQNYFHRIGLDPSYRQGTDSELGLLKNEVLEQILEDEYEKQEPDFVELADITMFNRSDAAMMNRILELYDKAMSDPFPIQWLERMQRFLNLSSVEEWLESDFVTWIVTDSKKMIEGIEEAAKELMSICHMPDGPYYFEKHVEEIISMCESMLETKGYEELYQIFASLSFSRMVGKKDESINPEKGAQVSEGRNYLKKIMQDMIKQYFFQGAEAHLLDLQAMSGKLRTLLRLTRRFLEEYTQEKRERNLVDFNDLEQIALEILLDWNQEKSEYVPSAAAMELAEHFEEIMIDEYQDSNRVQDTLLRSISRENMAGKNPNVFMVGDVKQSIYRFRNACPELFVEKLNTYLLEGETKYRRIDLHQNFRSREAVLEGTNDVFEVIMHADLGDVEYDEAARFQVGRKFAETILPVADSVDTYVILDKTDMEQEGRLIAREIKKMVNAEKPLYISEGDTYRPARYRDIVILMRSIKGGGQQIFEALTESGIPVIMDHSQGFYDTREIQLMTSMMQVIDNPRQDIPLATVLLGPMFSFDEEEVAYIRSQNKKMDLYLSLRNFEEEGALREKIQHVLSLIQRLREKVSYVTVAELIQDIYDETGIYESVMMMKEGAQRIANMDRLMEQAREFDETTYHGLYQFVRYLDRIREQQEEMGEVNIHGEEDNVVRIMTIHKSKGLEFPICFVAAMGKKLGGAQASQFLTIQPDLGIAMKIIDNETRTVKNNIYKETLTRQNALADMSEEMRVLYVAMTRAEEKLILVGSMKKPEPKKMDYLGRSFSKTYLDLILPVVQSSPYFTYQEIEPEELECDMLHEVIQEHLETISLNNFDTFVIYDNKMHEMLSSMQDTQEEVAEVLPVKVSVSDLKMKSMEELDVEDFTILSHEEVEDEMPIPAFMQGKQELNSARQGAAYGTIWHQVMATIDFQKTTSIEEIKESVQTLVKTGRLREEETSVLNYKKLSTFFQSNLGREMIQAAEENRLYREQPFVISRPAKEIFPERTEDEDVLIQGIMDGYYEGEDGIVLMDYKTDALQQGEEDVLIGRYETQMKLYREALEDMLDRPVSKCILYSFSLQKEIECGIERRER